MPASLLPAIPFLFAAGAGFLPGGAPLRHGAVGASLTALAVAAVSRVAGAPDSFHTINNTILWGGLMLGGVGVVEGWRRGHRTTLLPLTVALALALGGCGALLQEGHVIVSLFAGAAGAAALVALRLKPAVSAGTAAAAPGGTSGVVRQWGMPLLLSALLLPALWLVLTVAGPGNLSVQGLRDAPFSSAAEILLAALILPATLVLAGVFPFGAVTRGPRFAPLGALVLLLVVLPLLGEGLEHWRSPYAGWLVLGAAVAAWGAQWPRLLACAGLFAIACGGGSVLWAGTALTVIASLLSLSPVVRDVVLRVALLAAAACGVVALGATLGVEVVYSALMVLATVIGILRTPVPAADAGD